MKHHKRRTWMRRSMFFLIVSLVGLIGLQGCSRSSWHSPERMESRMTDFQADLADDLNIRTDQMDAYNALTEKLKAHARERAAIMKTQGTALKAVFDISPLNLGQVEEIVAEHIKSKANTAEHQALLAEVVAYIKTLDPEQQEIFRKKVSRKMNHFL